MSSCISDQEQKLTDYNWEIEKVVNLKTGIVKKTEENQVRMWNFNQDHTYFYDTRKENQTHQLKGKWDLEDYNLSIFNEFDSSKVLIEKITDDEMVWLIKEKDSVRFYFNSKVRTFGAPTFPNMPE